MELRCPNEVQQIHVGPDPSTLQALDAFWYDGGDQRFLSRERWDDNGTLRTRTVVYLGGDYEEVVPADDDTYDRIQRVQVTAVARQVRRRNAGTQTWEAACYEYAHRDHLGSVDAITDGSGTVLQKASFDPYGGRRATAWNADLPATGLDALRAWQDSRGLRGFTDHEHLNRTGFVHMNGRVYDPRIGRFVSPDPIVQAPWFSQSYNRYAYVFGSPLSFTDPNGYCTSHSENNAHLGVTCPAGGQDFVGGGYFGGGFIGGGSGGTLAGGIGSIPDFTIPYSKWLEDEIGNEVKVVVDTTEQEDGTNVPTTRFTFERERSAVFEYATGWERLDRVSNDPFGGFGGFLFRGYTDDMLRDSQRELGKLVAEYVSTGGGVIVAEQIIVRVMILGIQHPEVRNRIVAGALELADVTAGGQGWVTQMLRGEALRANSLPNEQVFVPKSTSPVSGLRPPPSP